VLVLVLVHMLLSSLLNHSEWRTRVQCHFCRLQALGQLFPSGIHG